MRGRAKWSVAAAAVVVASCFTTISARQGAAALGRAPGAGATSWAPGACVRDDAADGRYIDAIVRTFVGHPSTDADQAYWHARFHDSGIGIAFLAGVASKDPWFGRVTVTTIYTALFHRAADDAGATFWTGELGRSDAVTVTARMASSPEYWADNGNAYASFVSGLYHDLLGRQPDQAGADYWTNELSSGRRTTGDAIAAFDQEPESRLRRASLIFPRVLHRNGDPGGAAWAADLLLQGDESYEAATLASSQEFWNAAQIAGGGSAGPIPAPCPPPPPRWTPGPGAVVHNLTTMPFPPAPHIAALTFDDGPNPTWTPQILDILDRYDVPATFFVVGIEAQAHPDLVRAEVARGHHVADHSWNHPNFNYLTPDQQNTQIRWTADLLDNIVGPGSVRCFRPPYGNYSGTTVNLAADRGLATILWSRDGRDWAMPGVDAIVNGNLDTRYDGGRAVLLLHDGGQDRSQTVAALPRLIDALRGQGYVFVQLC